MKSILFIALLAGSVIACKNPGSSTGTDTTTPPASTTTDTTMANPPVTPTDTTAVPKKDSL